MTTASDISIEPVEERHRTLLTNLLEFYLHDMSEIFQIPLGADGRFGYEHLPLYWSNPESRFAFLFRVDGKVAGFALVTRGSPATDDPDDLDLSEFFVLRSFRRSGIGRRAAFLLWDHLPGRWVVRVSEKNHWALPFWEKAVSDYSGGVFDEMRHQGKTHMFRVFVLRS